MDNSDLIEQIELEQAQQNEIDDEIILCMAHEGEPDDWTLVRALSALNICWNELYLF